MAASGLLAESSGNCGVQFVLADASVQFLRVMDYNVFSGWAVVVTDSLPATRRIRRGVSDPLKSERTRERWFPRPFLSCIVEARSRSDVRLSR